jgi:PAS domain-containing protein
VSVRALRPDINPAITAMLPAIEAMTPPVIDPPWKSLAVALDAIGAAVYLKDGHSRYVFANPATERLILQAQRGGQRRWQQLSI